MIRPSHLLVFATFVLVGCGAPEAEPPSEGTDEMEEMAGTMMAHGDHSARYGGYVFMHGDLHFEVVLTAGGEHRLYFSDAMRSELPAAVAEDVRMTIRRVGDAGEELEPLEPRIDEFGEAWMASGLPVDTEDTVAIVYFRFEGSPYEIEVPFIMEPPAVDPHTGMPLPGAQPEAEGPRS